MKYLKKFRLFENNDDIKKIVDLFLSKSDESHKLAITLADNYDTGLIIEKLIDKLKVKKDKVEKDIESLFSRYNDIDFLNNPYGWVSDILINENFGDYHVFFGIKISSANFNKVRLLCKNRVDFVEDDDRKNDLKSIDPFNYNLDDHPLDASWSGHRKLHKDLSEVRIGISLEESRKVILEKIDEFNNYIETEFKKEIKKLFELFDEEEIIYLCMKFGIRNYVIHDDGTVDVKHSVYLENKRFKDNKLPIKFGLIEGSFYCSNCGLTTLENAPHTVEGKFDCSKNDLKSLKHCPKNIYDGFYCHQNKILTLDLDDVPNFVGGYFNCYRSEEQHV